MYKYVIHCKISAIPLKVNEVLQTLDVYQSVYPVKNELVVELLKKSLISKAVVHKLIWHKIYGSI